MVRRREVSIAGVVMFVIYDFYAELCVVRGSVRFGWRVGRNIDKNRQKEEEEGKVRAVLFETLFHGSQRRIQP